MPLTFDENQTETPAFTSDPEIDRQLAAFAAEEAVRLGIAPEREQYREKVNTRFTKEQRAHTTLLVSGLTVAQDYFVQHALTGVGYSVKMLDCPDNEALQYGKEYGNRGQCNPTWFTVGNLVKHLVKLRDVEGLSTEHIIEHYLLITAGACGPCRFGTYVTEYRKALRDAGFDGFRVMLFQQQGLKQATGEAVGLELNAPFFIALVKAFFAGDVVNLLGYRIRPYEVTPGATDAAMDKAKELIGSALSENRSLLWALHRAGQEFGKVEVDRLQPKPKVAIIGEFWAMTTEGDGNYKLQRFLEKEGAEVDIQPMVNWLLFTLWEQRHDTRERMLLREDDGGRKGLKGKDAWTKLLGLKAGEIAMRGFFQTLAHAGGLYQYHLPDMDEVADLAKDHYDRNVRGGEGHMEVGKVIKMVKKKQMHMILSVKPFGCMPSGGVSDGVQSLITAKYPELIFLPIETSGDGEVNIHSRVQMMLFRARQRAREELDNTLKEQGISLEQAKEAVKQSRWRKALPHAPHVGIGTAVNTLRAALR